VLPEAIKFVPYRDSSADPAGRVGSDACGCLTREPRGRPGPHAGVCWFGAFGGHLQRCEKRRTGARSVLTASQTHFRCQKCSKTPKSEFGYQLVTVFPTYRPFFSPEQFWHRSKGFFGGVSQITAAGVKRRRQRCRRCRSLAYARRSDKFALSLILPS
jgi:hypothetical protein